MHNLLANYAGTSKRVKMGGREYAVAPITLVSPGVLSGSKGPLLYQIGELLKSVESWNSTPLVVYHPTKNGRPVSAKSDGVLKKSGVGFLRNARIHAGRLKADAWIDIERAKSVDWRVYEAILNGTPMEISTGLMSTNEEVPPGTTWFGQPYIAVAKKLLSDHCAILPDQVGACSLADGCGLLMA